MSIDFNRELKEWKMVLSGLALALTIGGVTVWATGFENGRKQIVIEQVDNGWKISECYVGSNCPVTKVATSHLQANAIVWAYISGKPIRPDWKE